MCSNITKRKIRNVLKIKNPDLSDIQIEEIITAQYSIANIIFDLWLENKGKAV